MGLLGRYLSHQISSKLEDCGVLVWWDPQRSWQGWISGLLKKEDLPEDASAEQVELSSLSLHLLQFSGSYMEVADLSDELLTEGENAHLLIYVGGEQHLEKLSPLRELECLGGEREPFQPDLARVARQAFRAAGMPDAQIDELLNSGSLTFEHLDRVQLEGERGASPLAPIFGSGREEEVFPKFLASERLREQVVERELVGQVRGLAEQSFGISLDGADDAKGLARKLARVLLVAELRGDLGGPDPLEIFQVPSIHDDAPLVRARAVCDRLRALEPDAYVEIANEIERDLGLAEADIDPHDVGEVDTFSFEERMLLSYGAQKLVDGDLEEAQQLARQRAASFWTSVERFPDRRAEWQLLDMLAELARLDYALRRALASEPTSLTSWVESYSEPDGWHRADRLFRDVRSRLTRLDCTDAMRVAARETMERHDDLTGRMAQKFVGRIEREGWETGKLLRQRDVFARHVRNDGSPMAVILADALRFEMGAELAQVLESAGATSLQLDAVLAEPPTITPVGMAALLPGAERSFEVAYDDAGLHGVVDGERLTSARERMQHAKASIPGLEEVTLDRLVYELSEKELGRLLGDAPVVIVRSTEIDDAGERLPSGLARRIMGSVLEDIRKAVVRLAECGIHRFLIVADHGHLFSQRREDDMKIDAPSGGEQVALHRRCWIGRGANTPPSCARLSLRDLGYTSDLELVTPRGNGVFRAGGDLAYHHGGLSLQELVVPALSFEVPTSSDTAHASSGLALRPAADEITNRIFSLTAQRTELPLEPMRVKILAVDGEGRVVGQAMHATSGWEEDAKVLTLSDQEPVSVAIQIDDDDVEELRVVAVEVGTDRTVKDTSPLPVSTLR